MVWELIPVGKILKTHGNKGALKVLNLSDIPDRLRHCKTLFCMNNSGVEELTVTQYRSHDRFAIMSFENINSLSDGEKRKGHLLCIKEKDLSTLPEDTFYIHEIVGFTVFDESRRCIGKLKEIWQLPANDVFVVKSDHSEILIPATKKAIKKISTDDNEIIVNGSYGVIQ
jgi:16S rRNA processing protein RimM